MANRKASPRRLDKQQYVRDRVTVSDDGCWNWKLALSPDGYGLCFRRDWRSGAHTFSYAAFVGDVPAGMHLDHLCRNHRCVNPQHLEPVTPRENAQRGTMARNGRTYSLYLRAADGRWVTSKEIPGPSRQRRVFTSRDRDTAIHKMEAWLEANPDA